METHSRANGGKPVLKLKMPDQKAVPDRRTNPSRRNSKIWPVYPPDLFFELVEAHKAKGHYLPPVIAARAAQTSQPVLDTGIHREMAQWARANETSMTSLRKITAALVNSRPYAEAMAPAGAQRHDINGLPTGPISPEHRKNALQRLQMKPRAVKQRNYRN